MKNGQEIPSPEEDDDDDEGDDDDEFHSPMAPREDEDEVANEDDDDAQENGEEEEEEGEREEEEEEDDEKELTPPDPTIAIEEVTGKKRLDADDMQSIILLGSDYFSDSVTQIKTNLTELRQMMHSAEPLACCL